MIKRNIEEVSYKDLYANFILRKKAVNLSPETLKYYANCNSYFLEFFDENNLANSITKNTFYEFVSYLRENRNIKDVTLNSYLRGIRSILYFGMEEGYISKFKVALVKAEKPIKETYSDIEIEKLLEKPNTNTCMFREYRDWVIINYLLATGNRLSSMTNVLICDIDFSNNLITIRKTKNGKQQIIPLSLRLAEVLREYLTYRNGDLTDYLFCNAHGEKLTKSAAEHSIAEYNRKKGVTKTSIHLFRHTFAKKWILNGGDIFRLQKILGHSSLDIVKEYVNMFSADLQNDFGQFNPLDQISQGQNQYSKKISMRKK